MPGAPSIIITGAGSGIGRATARRFLAAGWRVAVLGRRADALRETAGDSPALILSCDVTDEGAVDAAFDRAHAEWGRLDVLFNNAGRGADPATPDAMDPATFREVMAVNVTGMFLCARAAFRLMRAQALQGGRIINNGSVSAHAPRPGSVAYTTSKHAVTGLTRSLSLDGRPFGIACGQIDIGNAATDLLMQVSTNAPGAEPMMDVAVVADAVLHMAGLPPGANVQFMTVMATNMPFIGRG
ncbi:SDR family NAD(P)-dependent oxidoreductase [Paracoccus sp. YIM 132242]|uniref:SDR family NAD(P)-dependent oxidoreductase n=1 Tax=Paracoccus lichenicola TaxID=2665644 RepID=A0A6L6HKR8_9RHOB|nr:SDR family oxidoreductase [Paracoccus lichenicola]MTD99725.1 SDR family NAD(P)-dependent oxidoreductase [Paracoccus lichenicola]